MNVEPLEIGEKISVDLTDCVQLGKLVGVWGVKGWLKVFSYTRPRKNINQYKRWLLVPGPAKKRKKSTFQKSQTIQAIAVSVKNCKEQGQNIVARIEGVDYRDQAENLLSLEVYIEKSQLKPLQKDEFYWSDMIGCDVVNIQNEALGIVTSIMETGANDVLVVQQNNQAQDALSQDAQNNLLEHLIPYSDDIVFSVDVENSLIRVDWGLDYLAQELDTSPRKKKQSKQERAEEVRLLKMVKQKENIKQDRQEDEG